MAELTPRERLQPSLLDRLTDHFPRRQVESRDERVLSPDSLRQCVIRDLGWLLNTSNLAQVQDISEYPALKGAVINYGIPDLAGQTVSDSNIEQLERQIRQAILDFEPRLMRDTVRVRSVVKDEMSSNALTFYIEGSLWAHPIPLQLYLRTKVDLESGGVTVEQTSEEEG